MVIEKYFIKGMICNRCIDALKEILLALGTKVIDIRLGHVIIMYDTKEITYAIIEDALQKEKFEILKDRDNILAEQTKIQILKFIWIADQTSNLSNFLSKELNENYQVLSRNFSKISQQTIEHYYIHLKVERIKELVENNELNFSEIAYNLGFSNLSALSRQFKKEAGMTMKSYKKLGPNNRISLNLI